MKRKVSRTGSRTPLPTTDPATNTSTTSQSPAEPRLLADGMLGSLARKLRILGFDTIYIADLEDRVLHSMSLREKRTLLTSDKALHEYTSRKGVPSILVPQGSDEKRLTHVLLSLGVKKTWLNPDRSRCPRCNGTLLRSNRQEIVDQVSSNIWSRHRTFYRCSLCGQVYWKGSHWRRITSFSRRVRATLQKADKTVPPTRPLGKARQTMEISDDEGETLVRLARKTVTEYLKEKRLTPLPHLSPKLKEKRGVFVTLRKLGKGGETLRGCIGIPLPERPLAEAMVEASLSSALRDPRFPPVSSEELDSIIFEVSILTQPTILRVSSPKDYPSRIRVGVDGLIVEWQWGSGLLLPQVATEYRWTPEDFLCNVCAKAGAPPDAWLMNGTRIQTFQAEVFEEESPSGPVLRKRP